eukprot:GHVH01017178.1.p2 GENE.GHVH01017178.1~~GHVH01017178.1.p2  ORF type:complete len:134 (-),score=19.56 GHVH01017178.1:14-415(-)
MCYWNGTKEMQCLQCKMSTTQEEIQNKKTKLIKNIISISINSSSSTRQNGQIIKPIHVLQDDNVEDLQVVNKPEAYDSLKDFSMCFSMPVDDEFPLEEGTRRTQTLEDMLSSIRSRLYDVRNRLVAEQYTDDQ